jgi:hypothetical protein
VALNSRTEMLARDRVKVWWVSFRSQETLDDFIAKVDGTTFNGTVLSVKVTESAIITKKTGGASKTLSASRQQLSHS